MMSSGDSLGARKLRASCGAAEEATRKRRKEPIQGARTSPEPLQAAFITNVQKFSRARLRSTTKPALAKAVLTSEENS